MPDTAIFDVDGTLVDTNYHHALAWYRALRRYTITRPLWRIHRAVGMGGDQFVPAVAGEEVEQRHGDALRAAWRAEFDALIAEVAPFEAARDLLMEVHRRGFRVVLASSGPAAHVEHFLDLVGARDIADAWTSSQDVQRSKPEPDLVAAALQRVDGTSGVMIGDSTWDVLAAGRAGVPTIAVRTGGYSVDELTQAGAQQVVDSLRDLLEGLDETLLARPQQD